jgi:transposase
MKRARSVDLRQQALAAVAGGASRREVCQLFGIHRNTLRSWQQRVAGGSLESRYHGGNPRKIKPEQEEALLRQLQASPDATLQEHAARWQEEQGQRISRSSMDRAVGRLKPLPWRHKKRA